MSKKRERSNKIDLRSIGTARVNSAPSYQQRPITPKAPAKPNPVVEIATPKPTSIAPKTQPTPEKMQKPLISVPKQPTPEHKTRVTKKEITKQVVNGSKAPKANILNDSNLNWLDEITNELKGKNGTKTQKPKQPRPSLKKVPEPKPVSKTETTQININICVPKLPDFKNVKLPKKADIVSKIPTEKLKTVAGRFKNIKTVAKKPSRKQLIYIISAFACLAVVVVGITQYTGKKSTNKPEVSGEAEQIKPEFTLIMPGGKIEGKISYNAERKTAGMQTSIGNKKVTISQQAIPEGFKPDPAGETAQLAKEINANDKLEGNGFTAHLGQSIKGPQTVLFTKSGTLVFIKSTETIPKEQWTEFLQTFK